MRSVPGNNAVSAKSNLPTQPAIEFPYTLMIRVSHGEFRTSIYGTVQGFVKSDLVFPVEDFPVVLNKTVQIVAHCIRRIYEQKILR